LGKIGINGRLILKCLQGIEFEDVELIKVEKNISYFSTVLKTIINFN